MDRHIARHRSTAYFDGVEARTIEARIRLGAQLRRIFQLMRDGRWRTLDEIAEVTGDPAASVSAQLRHLRKPRFGSHTVERRVRGSHVGGLYEYQLLINEDN